VAYASPTGSLIVSGDLTVTGDTGIGGDLNTTGDVGGATATITGNTNIGGDATITGDMSSATATVTGQLSAATGRTATFTIAAADSSALAKAQADLVCDGIDDDVQIQAAIDALPSVGGSVRLMEGTFTISSAIEMGNNTVLEGSGVGCLNPSGTLVDGAVSYIVLANSADCTMITNADLANHNITIKNLCLDGNKANQSAGDGIYIINGRECLIEHVRIYDAYDDGIEFDRDATSNSNLVTGCRIQASGDDGLRLASGVSDNRITENIILTSGGENLVIVGGFNQIIGNHLGNASGHGAHFYRSQGNTFTGNVVNRNDKHGVFVQESSNNVIVGNMISDNNQDNGAFDGIQIACANGGQESLYNIIGLNRILDETGQHKYAIREVETAGAVDWTQTLGNILSDGATGSILLVGGNSTDTNNLKP
jgi:parallel beta-helix repeat protein